VSGQAGDPFEYHFDLRDKALAAGPRPEAARAHLQRLTSDAVRANPVSIVQFALGTLQLGQPERLPLVAEVVAWIERTVDSEGRIPYRFAMPHTFRLEPPWYSALAQGEATSLLVRAAVALDSPGLLELAARVAQPLLDLASPLVAATAEGPVLQEYPTEPPAHVLNGWITALWGLHDLARAAGQSTAVTRAAADAFAAGARTVAARIERYRLPLAWSRYDLYPHRLPNVASPFYHRLHVGHLRRLDELAPDRRLSDVADEWERALRRPLPYAVALTRKAAFRMLVPRHGRGVAFKI